MEQHNGLYFTIWYGVYDSQERLLTFSSGGHHPAYLVPTPLERPVPLGTRNPSVGFIEDRVFVSACAPIPRGGALHLFSDGVFEIVDQSGQSWNMDNLLALLPLMSDAGGPQRLYDHVRATARGGRLDDDFSAVLLRFQ
jgi:serine phosphatase RsbU (regulator of sigma subunit)